MSLMYKIVFAGYRVDFQHLFIQVKDLVNCNIRLHYLLEIPGRLIQTRLRNFLQHPTPAFELILDYAAVNCNPHPPTLGNSGDMDFQRCHDLKFPGTFFAEKCPTLWSIYFFVLV